MKTSVFLLAAASSIDLVQGSDKTGSAMSGIQHHGSAKSGSQGSITFDDGIVVGPSSQATQPDSLSDVSLDSGASDHEHHDPKAAIAGKLQAQEGALEDVFDVQLKSKGDQWGTCDEYFALEGEVHQEEEQKGKEKQKRKGDGKQKDKGNQVDKERKGSSPLKVLNLMWEHSWRLYRAGASLSDSNAGGSTAIGKLLAKAFFAIDIDQKGKSGSTGHGNMDEYRRNVVHDIFLKVGDTMFSGTKTEKQKIPLFCDSNWLNFHHADERVGIDAKGQYTFKPIRGSQTQSFKEVMMGKGHKDFDDFWYFFPKVSNMFKPDPIRLHKESFPILPKGQPPFQEYSKPKTAYDLCAEEPTGGFVLPMTRTDGTAQPVAIICPRAFQRFPKTQEKIDDGVKAGQKLENRGINALTLFRILIVAAHGGRFPAPAKVQVPKKVFKDLEHAHATDYETRSSWREDKSRLATSAAECMYLALFDMASPQQSGQFEQQAIWNADNYGWFALAAILSAESHLDWSTGVAETAGKAMAYRPPAVIVE